MKTKKQNLVSRTLGLLFILMLFASYSCDRNSDDRTDILENTSWNLIGYKDNRGNYSTVVYPNDCSDNSCYMLMFKDGSIFGTYDNIPQNKDFGLGNYIAYTDKRFEYIDLPAIETISFGENNDKYIQSMIFVNKYDIKDNILTLFTKESIETEGVILIFQKKEL